MPYKIKQNIAKVLRVLGYEITKIKTPPFKEGQVYNEYKKILVVPGFFSFEAFKLFSELKKISAQNEKTSKLGVLEIGVYCGMSLLGIGLIYKKIKVIGVDPFYETFEGSPTFNEEAKYLANKSKNQGGNTRLNILLKTISDLKLSESISVKKMTQESFLEGETLTKNQLVYLDGEHTYKSIKYFLDKIDLVLSSDGFLVLDDFFNQSFPGISEAIHTHNIYKKDLFPAFYGFNKAVFVYKPTEKYSKITEGKLTEFANNNGYRFHKNDNDASLIVQE